MQPKLFADLETAAFSEDTKLDAGKRVVTYLLEVRRRLKTPPEREFIAQINHAVNLIRSQETPSDEKSEQLILHAVEKSQAGTFEEISEDTRLSMEVVKQIVFRLEFENILGITSRGKNRMAKLIYSKRKT
jgi:hypothetical protein